MSFYKKLNSAWEHNDSLLCIGLDPLLEKLPLSVKETPKPIFEFNKEIIDKTADLVCAYKPQIAYYSAQKAEDQLEETISYIKKNFPHIIVILDSKRGDIGDTSKQYAIEAFDRYGADAITINPYMGHDSVEPFTKRKDKGVILLCKTSNSGSKDFQDLIVNERPLYQNIALLAGNEWNQNDNISLVMGATNPKEIKAVRELLPEMPFLVPGIGAQGGSLEEVLKAGINSEGKGLIINSSRSIIYASPKNNFADRARQKAEELFLEINNFRKTLNKS